MRFKASKPEDMVTVPARAYPDRPAAQVLISLMRRFQAAKRTAYQALRRGLAVGAIVAVLREKFFPNARWCQWAVADAKATIESQKEQVAMHVSDLRAKITKSEEKLERVRDRLRRQGITARLNKLRGKLAYWQGFLERGEVPPAVFGGRKNLLLVQRGELSKDAWRELRSNAFCSVGQANQKGLEGQHGNANTEVVYDPATDTFRLNVYVPPLREPGGGKPKRRKRRPQDWVTVPLEVPARYRSMLIWHLATGQAYTVRVVRRDGRFDCFISFPLGDTVPVDRASAMAGIDLNPAVVGATTVRPDGNPMASRLFPCPDLVHASHAKREWITGDLAKQVADWLQSLGVKQVALEELSFAQDHDTDSFFNRISHSFCKKLLFQRIVVALRKRGIAVFTVPARYSTLIGFFKYSETYGLSAHQAAALVIARRALGFAERMPREILRGLAPREGWRPFGLWGKLFGMFKAARRRASRHWNVRGFSPQAWLDFMFAGCGPAG
ncbi:MAG: transposase [Bacillota bacterium]